MSYDISRTTNGRKLKIGYVATIIIVKISLVYKSEERSAMDNYQPISVLPVLSKVMERVVYRQVYEYLRKNHLLSDNQFGFRRGSSTEHAVTYFTDQIRMWMDKGLLTGAACL